MAVEVYMPKMSGHMESGEILRWLVEEGQTVIEGQPLVEINTDKVATEIEAPAAGILKKIRSGAEAGVMVPVGETIAFIAEQADEEIPELPPIADTKALIERIESPGSPKAGTHTPPTTKPKSPEPGAAEGAATPLAMRLAEKHSVDLRRVKGSGPRGRIGKEDVLRHVEAEVVPERIKASPAARRAAREAGIEIGAVTCTGLEGIVREADVDAYLAAGKAGGFDWIELTQVQKITGRRMLASVTQAPQFYLESSANAEKLLCIRSGLMGEIEQATGSRLSITSLLVKVVALALQRFPIVNSSFEQGRIKQYRDINIGVAVGTLKGLVVPVICNAERKTTVQIHEEMLAYKVKAQNLSFTPQDYADGHFTLSNLGMYGVDRFRAIVNPPQCAVLAVGRIVPTPVGTANSAIELRPLINLGLTIDHRCLDGMQGAQFLACIKELVENPIGFLVRL